MLAVEALTKTYERSGRAALILDRINFDVADGSFVSILGPSGCGKSTLLRCIAGLAHATGGAVKIDGKIADGPTREMVYVFQEYSRSLFPWRRLLGNVAYPIEKQFSKREARRRASELISLVGLSGYESHYPWELSGGMQQRAAIARALTVQPRFLLMDEPFGALDAQTRNQLEDALLRLWAERPCTILFVTHDIDEAIYLSDRVLVLGAHPGHVAEDITIDLPRPRRQIETKEDPMFAKYRRKLFDLITVPGAEAAE